MDFVLFSATMKCMPLQRAFTAVCKKNSTNLKTQGHRRYWLKLKTCAKKFSHTSLRTFRISEPMPRPGDRLTVIWVQLQHWSVNLYYPHITATNKNLTTVVLHDIEVFQVEELSNPRVICKVVHGKGNHSILYRKTTGVKMKVRSESLIRSEIAKSFVLEIFFFTFWALILGDFSDQAVVEWMVPKTIFK